MTNAILDYKSSGVNIDEGNEFVKNIKPLTKSTHGKSVLNSIGGFAGFFELPEGYNQPVLVAATDGVGTKLKLAQQLKRHNTIGIDLVAMCANDIIVCGAKPEFFLDYYACNKLEQNCALDVIRGITAACKSTNISLLGGETAEMPGLYHNKDYDLAGFCVGIAEKSCLVDINNINKNDILVGLSSSGLHSNGFSLVRKILNYKNISLEQKFDTKTTIGEKLLTPTVLYQDPLHELITNKKVTAAAHITGGGLLENTARIIPEHLTARFDISNYNLPAIFSFLQKHGNINVQELWRTFNCGIGMVLVVSPDNADYVLDFYNNYEFHQYNQTKAFIIGEVTSRNNSDKKTAAVFK